ncbi:helix-turn-helix domain-containing protein [Magnetococcales bacterium HHB-1]
MGTKFKAKDHKGKTMITHLNQAQLAKRWSISQRTLENWRWKKRGPPYLKLGGRVVYPLEDIKKFESANRLAAHN